MRNSKNLQKIIVVVGPTSSGKSDLAAKLAKKFNGEIISADSRQVYKGMDIGTGKVPNGNSKLKAQNSKLKRKTQNFYSYREIRHHLLDVVSPKRTFTAARYAKLAERAIADIVKHGKLPIICGGTGFYIQALVDDIMIPQVPPNAKLRHELEKKPLTELARLLRQKDPERAATIDLKNKRRIIRALEIIDVLGKVPKVNQPFGRLRPSALRQFCPESSAPDLKAECLTTEGLRLEEIDPERSRMGQISNQKFNPLFIGIQLPPEKLRTKIKKRLLARLKQGMIAEVETLHHQKNVSWKKLESFGLEYRYVAQYLQKKGGNRATASLPPRVSYEDMTRQLELAIWHYAKRQMTWFKKDKRIRWVGSYIEALRAAKEFLKS